MWRLSYAPKSGQHRGKPYIQASRVGRWRRATSLSHLWASFLVVDSGWRDPEAERCASSSSATDARQRGAAGTRFLTWLDGLAQGGGAVCCHGGTDGRNDKVYAEINP
jgi:hypothetical protein